MSNFRRDESGEIQLILTTQEVQVLKNLTEQLIELLGEGELHTQNPGETHDSLLNLMGIGGSDSPPDDPVLRRLFPDGYADRDDAAEFRRYTEQGLREKKRTHAYLIHGSISSAEEEDAILIESQDELRLATLEISIPSEAANAWLGGLNDLRLALAVRLGIAEGKKSDGATPRFDLMIESDPLAAVYAVYSWLGWLQQSLLELLLGPESEPQI